MARDGSISATWTVGTTALRRLSNDGKLQVVKLPFEGSFDSMSTSTRQDGVVAARHQLAAAVHGVPPRPGREQRPRPCRWRRRRTWISSRFEAIRTFATARDGTKVPLSIVARKGLKRDGRNPTMVNAYGAYQISYTPYFNARGVAFLEQGGVLAYAHVRGGRRVRQALVAGRPEDLEAQYLA